MKTSIWDLLTGVTLFGILLLIVVFAVVLINPSVSFNPFPPGAVKVPTISIPTDTPAPPSMPPTWTPAPQEQQPTAVQAQDATAEPAIKPTLRPSSTPVPTNTIVVLPTFTATRQGAYHGSGSGGVSGGGCTITFQEPKDDESLKAGTDFVMRWTIKNTSIETWRQDSADIRWTSGDKIHTGADVYDLPYNVSPSAMVDVLVSMRAPSSSGSYTSNWAIRDGDKNLCRFFVTIKVP